jgi:hypothetical protein
LKETNCLSMVARRALNFSNQGSWGLPSLYMVTKLK